MNNILALVLVVILFAASCKKEDSSSSLNNTTTTFKTYGSIDEIFSQLSLQPKVVQVDAAAGASFYGNSGTRYIFQPNCFVDGAGNTVTGFVQVAVTEWQKKGDMIFSGMLPVSDGQQLVSGGEINVKATKGGNEVFLKPGMTFTAKIPQFGSKDTVLSLFNGDTTGATQTSKVNWKLRRADSSNATIAYGGDTVSLFADSLKFWNSDHYLSTVNLQTFQLSVAATGGKIFAEKSLYAYALFDTQNGVMYLHDLVNGVFSINYIPRVSVHFIAFGLIDGHFYAGVGQATPAITGSNYSVALTEVDPATFKAQINALY